MHGHADAARYTGRAGGTQRTRGGRRTATADDATRETAVRTDRPAQRKGRGSRPSGRAPGSPNHQRALPFPFRLSSLSQTPSPPGEARAAETTDGPIGARLGVKSEVVQYVYRARRQQDTPLPTHCGTMGYPMAQGPEA